MRCKLTRIVSIHENLRSDEIVGSCDRRPTVGQSFFMVAPPFNPTASIRAVETTPVAEIVPGPDQDVLEFKTMNSDYRWEFLGPGR